eukprot:149820_1
MAKELIITAEVSGECINSAECYEQTLNHQAHCLGYESCYKSTIDTTEKVTCSGQWSCSTCCDYQMSITSSNDIICSGEKSCYGWGGSVYIPITSTSGNVECSGPESCKTSHISAGKTVDCSSVYSCRGYSITEARVSIIAQDAVQCTSRDSCKYNNIHSNTAEVTCSSDKSCDASDITAQSVHCKGEMSCSGVNIVAHEVTADGCESLYQATIIANKVVATGYQSLQQATISTSSSSLNVELTGYNTGNDAEILCTDGQLCTVKCSGTACEGLTFKCSMTAQCNVEPVGCGILTADAYDKTRRLTNEDIIDTNARTRPAKTPKPTKSPNTGRPAKTPRPDRTRAPKVPKTPKNKPKPFDKATGTVCPHYIKSDTSELLRTDIVSKQQTIDIIADTDKIVTDNAGGPCDDAYSCSGQTLIDKNCEIWSFNGYKACEGCTIEGDCYMYCTGDSSCKNAVKLINGDFDYNFIQCSGPKSCYGVKYMYNGPKAYCKGIESCANIVEMRGMDVYCDGKRSCINNNMDLMGDVHCIGQSACHGATVTAGDSIYCGGAESCSQGIYSAFDEIICRSEKSCFHSTITSASKLLLKGSYDAVGSNIYDIQTIQAYGKRSLQDATISTSKKAMHLWLYGEETGYDATISCPSGAICQLNCKANGCFNTNFLCENGAICTVNPVECKQDNSVNIAKGGAVCPKWKVNIANNENNDHDELFVIDSSRQKVDNLYGLSKKYYLYLGVFGVLGLMVICYKICFVSSKEFEKDGYSEIS